MKCEHDNGVRILKTFHNKELIVCNDCNLIVAEWIKELVSDIIKEIEGMKHERM